MYLHLLSLDDSIPKCLISSVRFCSEGNHPSVNFGASLSKSTALSQNLEATLAMGPPKLPWVVGASRPLFGVSSSAALPRVSRARRRRLSVSLNTLRLSLDALLPRSLAKLSLSCFRSSSLRGRSSLSKSEAFRAQDAFDSDKTVDFPRDQELLR